MRLPQLRNLGRREELQKTKQLPDVSPLVCTRNAALSFFVSGLLDLLYQSEEAQASGAEGQGEEGRVHLRFTFVVKFV